MKTYTVDKVCDDEAIDALNGEFLGDEAYDLLIDHDADIFRADGSPLIHFRRNVVSVKHAARAFPVLFKAAQGGGNRGTAAGRLSTLGLKPGDRHEQHVIGALHGDTRYYPMKKDGTISKRSFGLEVPSSVIGSLERSSPAIPYCRLTAFTAKHLKALRDAAPFIRTVDTCFRENSPQRHAAQLAECNKTHPDYIISGTAFSTITVNRNWRTALHKDVGDLRSGFGVLAVLSEGRYEGGLFVVPQYGVAVNMRHGDVLLVDVHEWHCNTPLVGVSKYWTRLSCVFYFRRRIVACKSLSEETERAKRRQPGDSLFNDFEGEFPE